MAKGLLIEITKKIGGPVTDVKIIGEKEFDDSPYINFLCGQLMDKIRNGEFDEVNKPT